MKQSQLIDIQGDFGKIKEVFVMKKLVVITLVGAFCLLAVSGFAQGFEEGPGARQSRGRRGFEGKNKQRIEALVVFATLLPQERAELLQLRRENKEEFDEVIGGIIRERIKELHEIKQADPQEFERLQQIAIEEVKAYGEQVKEDIKAATRFKKAADQVKGKQYLRKHLVFETLPSKKKEKIIALRERYQEVLEVALKERGEELEALKKENPEKFKKIISQAMESTKERMAKGRREKSKSFERFGNMKPEYLKEKLDWLKSEDPELYQYMIKRGSSGQRNSR